MSLTQKPWPWSCPGVGLQIIVNTKVRTVTSRAYGFHSAAAAAAMGMLTCGPIAITLPHQKQSNQ